MVLKVSHGKYCYRWFRYTRNCQHSTFNFHLCGKKCSNLGCHRHCNRWNIWGAKELGNLLSKGNDVNWSELVEFDIAKANKGFKWGAIIGAVSGGIK